MPRPQSDQALRRLLAELATTSADDLGAILAGLDPSQRQTVTALLATYDGASDEPVRVRAATLTAESPPRVTGLSPWLAARLKQSAQSGSETDEADRFARPGPAITPAALAALRASATALQRRPVSLARVGQLVLSQFRVSAVTRRGTS